MKFIKRPTAKRNDKIISRKQKLFTALYEDIPNSEIPESGVAKSDNILLMGNHAKVRFGSTQWASTTLPSLYTGTASQATTVMTVVSGFTLDETSAKIDNGLLIYWNDGTVNQITDVNSGYSGLNATVTDSATKTTQAVTLRSQVNGIYWHQKSQKLFLHIGTKLYYSTYTVGSWTEIVESSGNTLADSRSSFDSYQNYVYIFNANGVYKIETATTPLELFAINTSVATNTINSELTSPTWDYPTKDVESRINRFGRNYLFSLLRLTGTGVRDQTTTRIKKETPTNSVREDDDWKDEKTAYFPNAITGIIGKDANIGTDDYPSVTYLEYKLSNSTKNLKDWYLVYDKAVKIRAERRIEITTLTSSGTTATATTNVDHNLISGTSYAVAGATQTDYNGSFTVTVTSLTTFTYTMDADPAVDTATGNFIYVVLPSVKNIVFDFRSAEKSWKGIADSITDSMRDAFSEYPYCYCYHDIVEESLNFISGENDVYFNSLNSPFDDFDELDSGYIDTSAETSEKIGTWQALGDTTSPLATPVNLALQVPSGQYGWTHFSIYSTRTFGVDTEVGGNETIDINAYIWNTDIPVVNIVEATHASNILTAEIGSFSKHDVGCRLQSEGGDLAYIVSYLTSTTVVVSTASSSQQAWAIGAKTANIMVPSQSGTTVTKPLSNGGDETFASADVGKTIYWADGTYSIIKTFTSSRVVEVYDSATRTTMPMTFEPNGRDFSDVIKDSILFDRRESYNLLNRFWTNLPSGKLGVVHSNYMVVADRLDIKAYYSQFSAAYNYLSGHYYAEFQFLDFKDRLISIQEMPNQIVFFCSKSTWRVQSNIINTVGTISTMASIGNVDSTIGAQDQNGITNYGTGQKIVITSEPGIRTFDGYKYSENMILDQNGISYIKKSLQQMRNKFMSIYEPNLYGFIFWGNTSDDVIENSSEIAMTDVCYRRAIKLEQGYNFSKLTGDDWLWPSLGGGVIEVDDSRENKIILIFDYKSTKPYILSTRKLPNVESQAISYVDKENDQDTEITSSWKPAENTAEHEADKIKILEQYLFLRPETESNKSASGYDAYGFRDAQRLTIKAYINGETTNTSLVNTVNPKSELSMPEKVEDRRIQMEFNATASELIYTKHDIKYLVLNRRQSPANVVQQDTYERNLAYPIFAATRGRFFYYNLYTGSAVDSGTVTTKVTGPDGVSNSGLTVIDTLTWTNSQTVASGGTFTFMFGFRNNTGDIANESIFDLGDNITIKITRTASSALKFTYTNGTDTLDLDLTYSVAWLNIAIVKVNTALSIYVNGVLIDSETITVPVALTGNIVAYSNTNNCDVYDIRIYSSAITANELLWYYDNVVNKSGKTLLPAGES